MEFEPNICGLLTTILECSIWEIKSMSVGLINIDIAIYAGRHCICGHGRQLSLVHIVCS